MPLPETMWQALENTDSNELSVGDWDQVQQWAQEVGRDAESLKAHLSRHHHLEAPIIMQYGERYHLVAGNTRLMVARAAGISPSV